MSTPKYTTSTTIPAGLVEFCHEAAIHDLRDGTEHISVRHLLERARSSGRFDRLNNNLAPEIARKLIAADHRLRDVIQVRALARRGKNVAAPDSDLAVVLAALAERPQIRITAITCVTASGTVTSFDVATMAKNLRAAANGAK